LIHPYHGVAFNLVLGIFGGSEQTEFVFFCWDWLPGSSGTLKIILWLRMGSLFAAPNLRRVPWCLLRTRSVLGAMLQIQELLLFSTARSSNKNDHDYGGLGRFCRMIFER
jgi:hypothetical protein